jgi:hypothetical protein
MVQGREEEEGKKRRRKRKKRRQEEAKPAQGLANRAPGQTSQSQGRSDRAPDQIFPGVNRAAHQRQPDRHLRSSRLSPGPWPGLDRMGQPQTRSNRPLDRISRV